MPPSSRHHKPESVGRFALRMGGYTAAVLLWMYDLRVFVTHLL